MLTVDLAPVVTIALAATVPATATCAAVRVTDGANQDHMIGEDDWGTLKGQGPVTVHAELDPDVDGGGDLIEWSGATGDGVDAQVDTSAAAELIVKATVGTSSASLNVWVMWADIALDKCGAQQCDTDALRTPPGRASFPDLGPEAFPIVTAEAADGQVEVSATLSPAGVNAVLDPGDSGWAFVQLDTFLSCSNGAIPPAGSGTNTDDTPDPAFVQAAVGPDDQIYYIDAPTCGLAVMKGNIRHTTEVYNSFRAWATWGGTQASDILFWHYNANVSVDGPGLSVPLNDVGTGATAVPTACHYKPFAP
jgi:hypothetical protein